MKPFIITFLLLIFVACGNPKENKNNLAAAIDSASGHEKKAVKLLEKTSDKNTKPPFYAINISAFPDAKSASEEVLKLKKQHKKASYLWLPDYQSVSNKELFLVFLGPYKSKYKCMKKLEDYKKENKSAYAILVAHDTKRLVFYSNIDERVNNKKKKLMIIYSTKADEQEYANEGGEDWGWFVGEVSSYFSATREDDLLIIGNEEVPKLYMDKLVKKLEIEGFGYVLINGTEKTFLAHDMSEGIIEATCDFMGWKFDKNWHNKIK